MVWMLKPDEAIANNDSNSLLNTLNS